MMGHENLRKSRLSSEFNKHIANFAISLRREHLSEDEAFLLELFEQSRCSIFDLLPLSRDQKRELIKHQFRVQHQSYSAQFHDPSPEYWIIVNCGTPIGRLYIWRSYSEIRVIDISISMSERNKGIGSALIKKICQGAEKKKKRVSLHVEIQNPAFKLYKRLGFKNIATNPPYYKMYYSSPVITKV